MSRADLEKTLTDVLAVDCSPESFNDCEVIDRYMEIRSYDDARYIEAAKKENLPLVETGKIYDNRLVPFEKR
jgi:hypothetical protein